MAKLEEKRICKCMRCKHKWLTNVECPAQCPHCHSYDWDIPRKIALPKKHKGK